MYIMKNWKFIHIQKIINKAFILYKLVSVYTWTENKWRHASENDIFEIKFDWKDKNKIGKRDLHS